VKYVVIYESPAELDPDKVREHFPAHRARWSEFVDDGTLLAIGPFADPRDGAMSVFATREAAEAFVASDPFVLHDVVAGWTIKEWNEVLL
jgi:uncharacterized protein YciI